MEKIFSKHAEYFDSIGQHQLADLAIREAFANIEGKMQKISTIPNAAAPQSPPSTWTGTDTGYAAAVGVGITGLLQLAKQIGKDNAIRNTLAGLQIPATPALMNHLEKAGSNWPSTMSAYLKEANPGAYDQFRKMPIGEVVSGLLKRRNPLQLGKDLAQTAKGVGRQALENARQEGGLIGGASKTLEQGVQTAKDFASGVKDQGLRESLQNVARHQPVVPARSSVTTALQATDDIAAQNAKRVFDTLSGKNWQPGQIIDALADGGYTPAQISQATGMTSEALASVSPRVKDMANIAQQTEQSVAQQGKGLLEQGEKQLARNQAMPKNVGKWVGRAGQAVGAGYGLYQGITGEEKTAYDAALKAGKVGLGNAAGAATIGTGIGAGLGAGAGALAGTGALAGATAGGLAALQAVPGVGLGAAGLYLGGRLIGEGVHTGREMYRAHANENQALTQKKGYDQILQAQAHLKEILPDIQTKQSQMRLLTDPAQRNAAQRELQRLYNDYYTTVTNVQNIRNNSQGALYSKNQWTPQQTREWAAQHGITSTPGATQ